MPFSDQNYTEPSGAPDLDRPSADLLVWAYCRGVFPMADPDSGQMMWVDPDPRGVIPLDAFRVPASLARVVRRQPFMITADRAFEAVMKGCAEPRPDEDNQTWIDDRLLTAYTDLHHRGGAHSIEAWHRGQLVGGLYGVQIGGAFFGESMFIRPDLGGTNASKVCLVHLVNHLRTRGFLLLDTQFWNPHLDQFGCVEIPRADYLAQLGPAITASATWGAFARGEYTGES
jgi:leucyl/phenylalanyl-tRNA--protein transferase